MSWSESSTLRAFDGDTFNQNCDILTHPPVAGVTCADFRQDPIRIREYLNVIPRNPKENQHYFWAYNRQDWKNYTFLMFFENQSYGGVLGETIGLPSNKIDTRQGTQLNAAGYYLCRTGENMDRLISGSSNSDVKLVLYDPNPTVNINTVPVCNGI